MNKQDFLTRLRNGLSGLPENDIEERITFYAEMIDDRIEEGLTEDEVISALEPVEDIIEHILADTPMAKIVTERIRPKRRLKPLEIVLLALGSPIWLSLAAAALAIIFSLYIALWSIIISLWSVFASLAACAVAGIPSCVLFAIGGNTHSGIAALAAGFVCAGLSIFAFYACIAATKRTMMLTKNLALLIKKRFIAKEEVL